MKLSIRKPIQQAKEYVAKVKANPQIQKAVRSTKSEIKYMKDTAPRVWGGDYLSGPASPTAKKIRRVILRKSLKGKKLKGGLK